MYLPNLNEVDWSSYFSVILVALVFKLDFEKGLSHLFKLVLGKEYSIFHNCIIYSQIN